MKKIFSISTVALIGLTLTACSGTGGPNSQYCGPGGPTVDLVQVNADISQTPDVSFPYPLKATDTESRLITSGNGENIDEDQILITRMSIYEGMKGTRLFDGSHSDFEDDPLYLLVNKSILADSQFAEAYDMMKCAPMGSRFVLTTPTEKVFDQEQANQYGLDASDALVYVIDIVDALLKKADGTEQVVTNNSLPSLSFAPDGTPGLTFRDTEMPEAQLIVPIKIGHHEAIKDGDSLAIHQQTWSWKDRLVTNTTWVSKTPSVLQIGSNSNPNIPDEILTQYPVGSQIMILTPTEDQDDVNITVVDLLGVL